jgi:hypothetical protein
VSFADFTLSGTKVQIKKETAKEIRRILGVRREGVRREGEKEFRTIVRSGGQ